MGRVLAVFVAALLLSTSCRYSLSRNDASEATPEPVEKVGQGLLERVPSGRQVTSASPRVPLFVLRLVDDNGLNPKGIPVRVELDGNVRTVSTDGKGEVSLYRAGVYKLRVVDGCHERVHVMGGGYATVGVYAGPTKRNVLPVQWEHRYGPSPPVSANWTPWRVGRDVVLTYDVLDRCQETRAAGVAFPTFSFRPSANLEVVGQPALTSDRDGRATVVVRCLRVGDVTLALSDEENSADSIDLVAAAISFGGRPTCRS